MTEYSIPTSRTLNRALALDIAPFIVIFLSEDEVEGPARPGVFPAAVAGGGLLLFVPSSWASSWAKRSSRMVSSCRVGVEVEVALALVAAGDALDFFNFPIKCAVDQARTCPAADRDRGVVWTASVLRQIASCCLCPCEDVWRGSSAWPMDMGKGIGMNMNMNMDDEDDDVVTNTYDETRRTRCGPHFLNGWRMQNVECRMQALHCIALRSTH